MNPAGGVYTMQDACNDTCVRLLNMAISTTIGTPPEKNCDVNLTT
ncbi:MAG: hypothetical protein WCJ66_07020 [Verrucomicrobiota bacterium]